MGANFSYLLSQKNFCYPRWLAKLTRILIHPGTNKSLHQHEKDYFITRIYPYSKRFAAKRQTHQ